MKILAIRGSNLASLAGEFNIDFTSADFSQNGLIAITGTTGSGKSTVLDALCLALFNRIPRLPPRGSQTLIGRVDEDEKQRLASHDVRHILRRGTGEGYAEVDFLGVDKKKYRATWSIRRARKRPDGRFQAADHACIALKNKKTLGSTRKETEDAIVNKLGLSFDQFRRSVLLAQGDFASFLKADAATRSRLLEMITGTEVYGEISRQAHQRANKEIEKLNQFSTRLSEYDTLNSNDREILKGSLAQQEELLVYHQKDLSQWKEQLNQLKQLSKKAEQLKQAKVNQDKNQREWRNTEATRNELHQLKQLQILRLPLQRIDDAQSSLTEVQSQCESIQLQCNETKKQFKHITNALKEQQIDHQKAESSFQHAKPQLREAYKLDDLLQQLENEKKNLQKQLDESKHHAKNSQQSLQRNQSILQESKADLLTLNDWVIQHKSDEVLASQWQLWKSILDNAISNQTKQQQYQLKQKKLKAELVQNNQQQEKLQKSIDISQQQITIHEQALSEFNEQKSQLKLDQCTTEIQSHNAKLIELKEIEALQQQYHNNQAEQHSVQKDVDQLKYTIQKAKEIQKITKHELMKSDIRLDEANKKNQRALLATGHSAKELRTQLSEGEPCSVCGSREHPFHTQGNTQLQTFAEMQNQRVQELQTHNDNLKQQLQEATSEINYSDKQRTQQNNRLEAIQKDTSNLLQRWESLSKVAITLFQASRNITDTQTALKNTQDKQHELNQQRAHIVSVRRNRETCLKELEQQQQKQLLLNENLQKIQSDHNHISQQNLELQNSLQQAHQKLSEVIPNIHEITHNLAAIKASCQARVEKYQHQQNRQSILEKTITLQQNEIEKQLIKLEYANSNQQAQEKQRQILEQRHIELIRSRKALFSDYVGQTTKAIEQTLATNVENSYNHYKAIQKRHQTVKENLITQQSNLQNLHQRETELTQLIQKQNHEFERALKTFSLTEATAREKLSKEATWITQQEQSVEQLKQALHTGKARVKAIAQELNGSLNLDKQCLNKIELLNIYTDKELSKNHKTLLQKLNEAEQEYTSCQTLTNELKFQLREDNNKRKQAKKLQKNYDKQDTITHTWKVMKQLIGSQSGAKFRNFAQSLTLEILISHANQRMQELNRRYALQRVPQTDLELQVIDKEMGDEIRPIHSLSGGESFLVSLALALGLASLSSRKTQIDSLFIDEGFGTLDPQTLDTALSALDSLQSQGKTVCIISHIPAITERVATQIQVQSRGNGKSHIELL